MSARDLVKRVADPSFTVAGALVGTKPHEIVEAIESYEAAMVPLKDADPQFKGHFAVGAMAAARAVGAKLAPHLSSEQASAWVDAIMLSLSKWPPKVVQSAMRAAVHEPFKFIGDVDKRAHELAEQFEQKHRLALRRLYSMKFEIELAANPPKPQLAAPSSDPMPLDEVRRCPPSYLNLGLKLGAITQEDYDTVTAERQAEAEAAAKKLAEDIDAQANEAHTEPGKGNPEEQSNEL